jgi:hypothetical protein
MRPIRSTPPSRTAFLLRERLVAKLTKVPPKLGQYADL